MLVFWQCANPDDQECKIWFIDNHVNDLIELTAESPVQDFIRLLCMLIVNMLQHDCMDHSLIIDVY